MAARLAVLVVALGALVVLWAWLGAARDYGRAIDLARERGAKLTPGQAEQVRRDLRAAGRRNPSTEPELALAQLDMFLSRPGPAARGLREIVRSEPDNAAAWGLLATALDGIHPTGARDAARREARLRAGFVRRD